MRTSTALRRMRGALVKSPNGGFVAELWIQIIKHHRELAGMRPREVAAALELAPTYAADVSKALKIAPRLAAAGVDSERLR